MARQRTTFVCADCGHSEPKWAGQCPSCRAWNTMRQVVVAGGASPSAWAVPGHVGVPRAERLSGIETQSARRRPLGMVEFDRVLGGGVVPGGLALVGGEPGIGKSTLLLQVSGLLAQCGGPVLYVSGEESAQQIKLRAERMGIAGEELFLLSETNLEAVLAEVASLRPSALVVDSIQTMYLDSVDSTAGSVTQVRECAARLMRLAKAEHVPVFLVGHVTKSGDIAGPRILEHMVDIVLYLEGDRFHSYRLLRSVKNRFGATNEVGVFEMRSEGLVEVADPSSAFLAERLSGVPGSAVTVTMEGSRPLLVEIQALVSPSGAQVPRRTANGVDFNRLLLLVAVLTRRQNLRLGDQDVFVNVVGGLKVTEPAVDLAVAAAIASSARGRALPEDLVVFGEIGLSGELRSVSQFDRRLAEAASLGYARALVPQTANLVSGKPRACRALTARTLGEALGLAMGAPPSAESTAGD